MTIPPTMRAVLLTKHGDLDALVLDEAWPTPEPGAGEVLLRVDACAINNTDINTRVGWYAQGDDNGAWGGEPLVFPIIQGADVCGVIAAVGEGVAHERLGERVLVDPWLRDAAAPDDLERAGYVGSEVNGGYADFMVVPARNAHSVASQLSPVQLAAFPTAAGTALDMLRRAAVGSGDRVLITGRRVVSARTRSRSRRRWVQCQSRFVLRPRPNWCASSVLPRPSIVGQNSHPRWQRSLSTRSMWS